MDHYFFEGGGIKQFPKKNYCKKKKKKKKLLQGETWGKMEQTLYTIQLLCLTLKDIMHNLK